MANYLTIISRTDFNNLYKYGHIFVHHATLFDGHFADHRKDKDLFDEVSVFMDTLEYSTEYLILHLNRNQIGGNTFEVFIKDVLAVYALNEEAQASLSVSFDSRINLQVSPWADFFNALSKKQSIRQSNAGIFNCFEIFGIEKTDRIRVNNILTQSVIEEIYNGLFTRERPQGEKSIWEYLIRYDRHSSYIRDTRGFFFDAIHAFENYKSQKELDGEIAESVSLGEDLFSLGKEKDFVQICADLDSNTSTNGYYVDGCHYIVVASLFLMFKSWFQRTGITPEMYKTILPQANEWKKQLGFDFSLAVGLLGLILGQEKTYSCYYEIRQIGIFNKTIPSRMDQEIPQFVDNAKETEVIQENHAGCSEVKDDTPVVSKTPATNEVPTEQCTDSSVFFPVQMVKEPSGKKKKIDERVAHDQVELESLLEKGYKPKK